MKKSFFNIISSKYRDIVFAVALFVFLDSGVLVLNYYISYSIGHDAHAIQLAWRQVALSQDMFHQLYQVRDDAENPDKSYLKTVDVLEKSYKIFDETMDAFVYGGELIGTGQDNDLLLNTVSYTGEGEKNIKAAEGLWKKYRNPIKEVAYAYFNDLNREETISKANEAINFAREKNPDFRESLKEFAIAIEQGAQLKASRLRMIQTIGISLAVVNFFLILFHFLRKMSRSDALIEKAQQETADILANVNEGLFLLDHKFMIGSQYSNSLKEIFRQEQFSGRSFFDLLKPLVTEKTLDMVEDYVEILFSKHVSPTLIEGLNPLVEVEVSFSNGNGDFTVRYLSFEFSRVLEADVLAFLLVTVSDITEKVTLQRELKRAEDKAATDIEMLLHVIHLDGRLLLDYLAGLKKSLLDVNELLMKRAKTQPQYVEKLLKIFRIIHTLKGECTALDLSFIESKLHEYETIMQNMKSNSKLSGTDFIPLTVRLRQLMSDVDSLNILVRKVSEGQNASMENIQVDQGTAGDSDKTVLRPVAKVSSPVTGVNKAVQDLSIIEVWRNQFEQVVAQIARDENKAVRLIFDTKGRIPRLNNGLKEAVKNITIQCLRNSVVHGIEPPSRRGLAGKSLSGELHVSLEHEANILLLKIRDDGQGINVDLIRERALASGLLRQDQLSGIKPAQLIKLIFQPGFSTFQGANNEQANRHAGRGVGLDVVKDIIEKCGAKMGVSYREGEYTEFRFKFDLSAVALPATA